jgi:hypothetical protein
MTEITKDQLQIEFDTLRKITELPRLHLANFFFEIRNEVDKGFVSKLLSSKNNKQQEAKLNETWQQTISKIYSFEDQCIYKMNKNLSDERIVKRLEAIESTIRQESTVSLEVIKESIEKEEIEFLCEMFQNKTIAFLYNPNNCKANSMKKLIVINDEYISHKAIKQR